MVVQYVQSKSAIFADKNLKDSFNGLCKATLTLATCTVTVEPFRLRDIDCKVTAAAADDIRQTH